MSVAKRLNREHPANVVRDRAADAHDRQEHVRDGVEGGRWPNTGEPGCGYCAAVAHAEANEVGAALANIFNPRAAGYVPRGFGPKYGFAGPPIPGPQPRGGKTYDAS